MVRNALTNVVLVVTLREERVFARLPDDGLFRRRGEQQSERPWEFRAQFRFGLDETGQK